MEDGNRVQKISPNATINLDFKNLEHIQDSLFTGFVRPFDLSEAPLLHLKVISTEKEEHYLLFDMHHIISDGMSMSILTKEFSSLYNGDSLPPLRVHYKDYSEWLTARDLTTQKEYWTSLVKYTN